MTLQSKPPVSAWIAAERKARGWKVEELSRRLRDMGYEAEVGTVRVWEAGRSPKAETIEALERLFESRAPRQADPDMGDIIAAIRALTESVNAHRSVMESQGAALLDVVAEMKEQRDAAQGRAEGLSAALGELSGTLESLRPALAGRSRSNSD